ncbi:MAG: enoyl-CoA hydratase/isomerase family protein [Acidimicrobiales bacterium]
MQYETITLDVVDHVARLTLNRPDAANAVNQAMGADLRRAALAISHNPDVRAVLLSGAGRIFSGGGDLSLFASSLDMATAIEDLTIDLHAALSRFAKMDAPLVAAVHGAAGGAGMSLVAAADLVVAGASTKFTMGYTKAGLVPDGSSSFYLSRVVGLRRAMDLVLTNRVLSAAEAEEWGLVSRVAPDAEVLEQASALAAQLAAGPTKAFGLAKRVVYEGAVSSLEQAMERESLSIAAAALTRDAKEGIDAFLHKRAAVFEGR